MDSSYINEANNYFKIYRDYFKQVILKQAKKASVILTNSGDRAVALEYKAEKDSCPKVTAKGEGDLAKLLYNVAKKNKIKIVDNKELTNNFFENIDINNYVPEEYWNEIAYIISNGNISINPSLISEFKYDWDDPIRIELGCGLVSLADINKGGDLKEKISNVRTILFNEFGLYIPNVRIIDNIELDDNQYCIKINGIKTGSGKIKFDSLLCINPDDSDICLEGENVKEPVFKTPAMWISSNNRNIALQKGYTIADHSCVIVTHLTEICRNRISNFLDLQKTKELLDAAKKDYPVAAKEAEKKLSISNIQKVLKNLLKEKVSIRNINLILETLARYGTISQNERYLTEKARQALGEQLCNQYADEELRIPVLTIDPELEHKIIDSRHEMPLETISALEPQMQRAWIKAVLKASEKAIEKEYKPVILCSEQARYLVKYSTDREIPDLIVLSVPEFNNVEYKPYSIAIISLEEKEDYN